MKKEAYYFSHDANAKDDPKILRLRMELGWEGYGLFWALIELLRNESDHRMRTHCKSIAFALQTQEEIIKSIINDFDLFVIDDEYFWSESLLKRMELKEERSEKARESAKKRWNKENDANAMRTHSERNADAMQVKESKGKEIKENESKVNQNKEVSAGAFFSLDEVFIDFNKEKPLKRPYFERMSVVHSTDTETIKSYFKKWATIKEGEPMTIAKAENSFNLYLSNHLKNNPKPPEKKENYNVFEEIWQDMQKEKLKNQNNDGDNY